MRKEMKRMFLCLCPENKMADRNRIIESAMRLLAKHHEQYMDAGGSHAEYCVVNELSEAQGDKLITDYLKKKKEKK